MVSRSSGPHHVARVFSHRASCAQGPAPVQKPLRRPVGATATPTTGSQGSGTLRIVVRMIAERLGVTCPDRECPTSQTVVGMRHRSHELPLRRATGVPGSLNAANGRRRSSRGHLSPKPGGRHAHRARTTGMERQQKRGKWGRVKLAWWTCWSVQRLPVARVVGQRHGQLRLDLCCDRRLGHAGRELYRG